MAGGSALKIYPGRHVELEIQYAGGEVERLSLDLVSDTAADFEQGFLGQSTPLAQAILGRAAGEVVAYRAGDALEVRILSVSAELSAKPTDLSERREETLRKALRDSDRTSTILFASSYNGKWGDYDSSSLQEEEEEDQENE
jgi:hypothetical protein